MGCWFHFTQCLVNKLKKLKISVNKYKNINLKLIYLFKYFPFLEKDIKNSLFKLFKIPFIEFNNIFDIDLNDKNKFVSFINYFEKNWLNFTHNSKIINLEKQETEIQMKWERTNNPCEIFNKLLNSRISLNKPRISYLTDHLFNIILSQYNECCNNLASPIKAVNKPDLFSKNFNIYLDKVNNFLIKGNLLNFLHSINNVNELNTNETDLDEK